MAINHTTSGKILYRYLFFFLSLPTRSSVTVYGYTFPHLSVFYRWESHLVTYLKTGVRGTSESVMGGSMGDTKVRLRIGRYEGTFTYLP
jgi:hypothetical protein